MGIYQADSQMLFNIWLVDLYYALITVDYIGDIVTN